MADRKRRRGDDLSALRRVLHTGGITMKGLHELMESLRGHDLDPSMHALREANSEAFRSLRLAIEVPLHDGGSWLWELIDPAKLFQAAVDQSPMFQTMTIQVLLISKPSPSDPWRLVIGFDEFMPGFAMW